MPIGVIVNCFIVFLGGLIGAFVGNKINKNLVEKLPVIFGLCAISISITLIPKTENLAPVILAIIAGTIIGEILKLENRLTNQINKIVSKTSTADDEKTEILITSIVLFCFSGTGTFGAINEGFTGDSSILFAKSIMDFFTAMILAASAGFLISLVSIPQLAVMLLLFFTADFIVPLLNDAMQNDFRGCGGIITLAAGLKIAKIKNINVFNMLPSMLIVIPLSYLWQLLMG